MDIKEITKEQMIDWLEIIRKNEKILSVIDNHTMDMPSAFRIADAIQKLLQDES